MTTMIVHIQDLRPFDKIDGMSVVMIHWNVEIPGEIPGVDPHRMGVRVELAHTLEYEMSHQLDENLQIIYEGEVQTTTMTSDFNSYVEIEAR